MGTQSSRAKRERMTRDNFKALQVLEALRNNDYDLLETRVLNDLEEACHYIVRLENQIDAIHVQVIRILDNLSKR